MRYFLTGATGFIGGRIARQLRAEDHEVVALCRSPEKAGPLEEIGVEVHPGDLTEKESMHAGMEGVDGVFHVAAWYRVGARDARIAETINVEGTRNVLELCRELEVPKTVYTSTLAVFGDTGGEVVDETHRPDDGQVTEYGRTKARAHYDVALPMIEEGLPLVIVQPGLVYGPGDTSDVRETLVRWLEGKLPAIPRGVAYCWAHVEDTARAHILAMGKGEPGETYIVCGPPHPLDEALELGEEITGIPAPGVRLSPWVLETLSSLMRPVAALLPVPSHYHPETLRASAGVTYLGDNSRAREELGFDPRPLEEGLRETLHHLMDELGMEPPQPDA